MNGLGLRVNRRGTYILVLEVIEKAQLEIRKLKWIFSPGIYLYFGSAKGKSSTSLHNRIKRHFIAKKKKFWHIDYLITQNAIILHHAYINQNEQNSECHNLVTVSKQFKLDIFSRFGSSDCKNKCGGHLGVLSNKNTNLTELDEYFERQNWLKITKEECK